MTNFFRSVLFISFVFSLYLLASCSKEQVEVIDDTQVSIVELKLQAVSSFVQDLTLEQKIAQLFLVSVDGTNAYLSATTHHVPPGGYVLFSRNTADGERNVITLIGDTLLHYENDSEILPYFSIDHEGGDVNRLRRVASPLPSAQSVASTLTVQEAQELYSYSAMQLKALGIHVNLGPMAEAAYASNINFTGTRSYGNRENTVLYSTAFLNGFRENDIYCVVKHFPGNTNDDPHYLLPTLKGDEVIIKMLYVEPFSTLLSNDGLLMSHVIVPAFDENNPACLSPTLINDLVKTELGFKGLIFSDDILMNALLENGYPPDIAISMALKAGVDVLMISHPAYWNIIPIVLDLVEQDAALESYIDRAVQKIIDAKIHMGLYEYVEIVTTQENISFEVKPVDVHTIYNEKHQVENFNKAKALGNAFYYKYW